MSSYEAIRQANIQRNQKFLEEIGIDGSSKGAQKSGSASKAIKKEKSADLVVPLRRSLRSAVVDLPPDVYKEAADERTRGQKRTLNEVKEDDWLEDSSERVQYTGLLASAPPLAAVAAGTGVSCSHCDADVSMLTGPDMLGRPMSAFGKLAVITAAVTGSGVPKFNKYAGALRWRNCVFLWVNIERKGSTSSGGYINEFTVNALAKEVKGAAVECLLTWYGSSKMQRDSDITQLILGATDPTAMAGALPVLLFTRLVGENYVSCGRVACVQCDEVRERGGGVVLKFTLRLAQYAEGLVSQPAFKDIMKEGQVSK